jgi:hypothetical protein
MQTSLRIAGYLVIVALVLYTLFDLFAPSTVGPDSVTDLTLLSRQIGLDLTAYARAHGGQFPDGQSSTEVFQKLLDGGYANRADIFYAPLPGKVNAGRDAKSLKPENVCWDVTRGVDGNSSDTVPIIFLTGYEVTYEPGARAVALHPTEWWSGLFGETDYRIAVCYRSSSALAMKAAPDGSIPTFIAANFDPRGQTYQQLTPDGKLTP